MHMNERTIGDFSSRGRQLRIAQIGLNVFLPPRRRGTDGILNGTGEKGRRRRGMQTGGAILIVTASCEHIGTATPEPEVRRGTGTVLPEVLGDIKASVSRQQFSH
jgi:hypothetical protein